MNIYLVGFMGTGKTSVAKEIAFLLHRDFVEIDDLIEEAERKKIVDIFREKGEAYFRRREKEILEDIAKKDNLIVSCGGGIVINQENIELMKKTGKVVCLKASADVIYERTKKYSHRPLLNVENPVLKIKELLKERDKFYRQADFFVDTDNLSIEDVSRKIINLLQN